MGGCLSLIIQRINIVKKQSAAPPPPEMAFVISVDGDLHEYNVPVIVSDVLNAETPYSSSCDDNLFVCNSSSLYYNDFVPCMSQDDHLLPEEIYFLLPISMINKRLVAADMAALANKASAALEKRKTHCQYYHNLHSNNTTTSQCQTISPLLSAEQSLNSQDLDIINACEISRLSNINGKANNGFSKSGSVRKLHKYTSSKRAIMAVCSFNLTLSTIYEGTVL